MQQLTLKRGEPVAVGLANGPIVRPFLEWSPSRVDYVEVPYEQLRFDPTTIDIQAQVPVLLHCSSMSIAGFVLPAEKTLDQIAGHVACTRTPWIGEHLAFISADALDGGDAVEGTVELTYTVCPQLSEETVQRVDQNLKSLRSRFDVPIILENSPQYFPIPGSTLTMPEFVATVAKQCDVDLLLDITHWLITAGNMRLDSAESAEALPLERVREVHLSGLSHQSGRWWDDHAVPVPDEAFELLERLAPRLQAQAVTFEYNWAPSIPHTVLAHQIDRVRDVLS
jgi:uncharacterized protein (UPF0276 family)